MPPTKANKPFFQHLLKTLTSLLEGTVIFWGRHQHSFWPGAGQVMPPGKRLTRPTKQSLRIAKLIFQHGLVDIWREVNPTLRDFTHFSNPHRSFTRIDHILITPAYILLTNRACIKDVVWSDHSMVILTLQHPMGHKPCRRWRLNESILSDLIRATEIEKNIWNYFLTNNTPETRPSCLWAAHIRGQLIQIVFQINKANKADLEKLEQDFTALTKKHKVNPRAVPTTELDAAHMALNLALTSRAEKRLRWNRSRFNCHGDNIGSLLTGRLSLKFRTPALPKIKIHGGTLSQNPQFLMGNSITSLHAYTAERTPHLEML